MAPQSASGGRARGSRGRGWRGRGSRGRGSNRGINANPSASSSSSANVQHNHEQVSETPNNPAAASDTDSHTPSRRGRARNENRPPRGSQRSGARPSGEASNGGQGPGPSLPQAAPQGPPPTRNEQSQPAQEVSAPSVVAAHLARQAEGPVLSCITNKWGPAGTLKRSRDAFEYAGGPELSTLLSTKGAVAAMMYDTSTAHSQANDLNSRNAAKIPARYYLLGKLDRTRMRSAKISKLDAGPGTNKTPGLTVASDKELSGNSNRRSVWNLPVELVALIASHLNRDEIQSMRLVNRELNHFVSQVVFGTVVVPFNTEIYGMLDHEPDTDGNGTVDSGSSAFKWKNTNRDDVYKGHGLDVFRGFGKHILRFGMSFEVTEDILANPPEKRETEEQSSFWGSYDWPYADYCRFDDVAGLETAADETPRMKTAFSELSKVKELALSVDSGLGWLNGPDRSVRDRILQRPPAVFGNAKKIPDRQAQAQHELWEFVDTCHKEAKTDVKFATLYRSESFQPSPLMINASLAMEDHPKLPFLDPQVVNYAIDHDKMNPSEPIALDPIVLSPSALDQLVSKPPAPGAGVLYTSMDPPSDTAQLISPVIPAKLTKAQKEWLLETEWAQRAFLSSYVLSVVDNPVTFHSVHTLNIARLSDRYIPALNRNDFWDALPNLKDVTLMVIPSWRSVTKDEAGYVETPKIDPVKGVDEFYTLLKKVVSPRRNISQLTIGWATGGEHAEGVHARNKLLLPAPLVGMTKITNQDPPTLCNALLQFPFLERITLKNCWITPAAVTYFVKLHDSLKLKHIVFDSVSLTAVLRTRQDNQAAANPVVLQLMNPPMPVLPPAAQLAQMASSLPNPAPHTANPSAVIQIYIQTLQVQVQTLLSFANANLFQGPIAALQNQLQAHVQLHTQAQQELQSQDANYQPLMAQHVYQIQSSFFMQLFAYSAALLQQLAVLPPPPMIGNSVDPVVAPERVLHTQPREGSWMNLIDILTPGPNLSDFGSAHSQADPERSTALESIQFISCGYARLPHADFDQSVIDTPANGQPHLLRNNLLTKRADILQAIMLSANHQLLGEVMQEVNVDELVALELGWHMQLGWQDGEAARAVELDGLGPGGSGRFSGVVRAADRVVDESQ